MTVRSDVTVHTNLKQTEPLVMVMLYSKPCSIHIYRAQGWDWVRRRDGGVEGFHVGIGAGVVRCDHSRQTDPKQYQPGLLPPLENQKPEQIAPIYHCNFAFILLVTGVASAAAGVSCTSTGT